MPSISREAAHLTSFSFTSSNWCLRTPPTRVRGQRRRRRKPSLQRALLWLLTVSSTHSCTNFANGLGHIHCHLVFFPCFVFFPQKVRMLSGSSLIWRAACTTARCRTCPLWCGCGGTARRRGWALLRRSSRLNTSVLSCQLRRSRLSTPALRCLRTWL